MATKGSSIEVNRKAGASDGKIRRKGSTNAEPKRTIEEEEEASRRNLRIGLKILAVVVLAAGVFAGYRAVLASPVFTLRHVVISGNHRLTDQQLAGAVRGMVGSSLMSADLYAVRRELQSLPLVKAAQLTRVLPDTLRIKIEERLPVALVKQANNSLVWVSEDNVTLGDLDEFRDGAIPPILAGLLAESDSEFEHAENQRRIALYRQILDDLDRGTPKLGTVVDEISLRQPKDVVLQISDSRIQVHVGEKDFRQHLMIALDVLEAARRGDAASLSAYRVADLKGLIEHAARITYFNVLRPDRIAVGFVSEQSAPAAVGNSDEMRNGDPGSSAHPAAAEKAAKEIKDGKAKQPVRRRN